MKKMIQFADVRFPKLYKELKNNLYTSIISDVNHDYCRYQGETNFLYEFGLHKRNIHTNTFIHRLQGNIEPHYDDLDAYKRDAYLFVIDVGFGNSYPDSQDIPYLYQNKEFMPLRQGDIIKFNQTIEHALFWDKRIDIATFWVCNPM